MSKAKAGVRRDVDGVGYVVSEVSPYEVDLDWENITDHIVEFGLSYAERVRRDHALIVEAFRAGRIGVAAT